MYIIVDTNIIISALIKDAKTREIITTARTKFLFPETIFQEIRKHKKEILDKSGLNEQEFDELLRLLLKYMNIVPTEQIKSFRGKALEIMKDIDINDTLFIATALAFENSVIWSDDKALKKQTAIKILNTNEMIKLFE